ncbi:AGR022Cp [Eremothecium gossypii ATCC 10895]|uniref:Nicotinamide-nucleotide adenylyltransferase n=1 Tax=Eremothecium gossypii (strain ATCC 10895 / CBS 109.51 / FGSC 9923 / NRRL Y-1056) TaxID=284811 RepID=Q750D3_EREGS|nr:AGR022Cp [Eremothecium gossypii ATCC 10895]AAS54511.2 AGR022Cp [Eremothecium gossypii ATCC 10895]AEY98843.1 FAGR022Cp [Eremothecium gossypii FDAG1]
MDPTRAPDFKPLQGDDKPEPPLAPDSEIPENGPIMPFVLADYNTSIDAPIHPKSYKKSMKRNSSQPSNCSKGRGGSGSIPLKRSGLEPFSNDVSSESECGEEDEQQGESHAADANSSKLRSMVQNIADLEEVPCGIIRQARILEDYEFPTHRLKTTLHNANKLPLVIVACGSFSPITHLHLRMFEMAMDAIVEQTRFEVVGGYYSPVSDNYNKPGLASATHRVRMCELACERTSSWLMVDAWESLQPQYTRTAKVLDHFNDEINVKRGGIKTSTGDRIGVKIMLLAGGDLIESMGEPNVWADADLHHILGNYGCLIVERTGSDVRSFLLSHDIMYEHRRNILVIKQMIYNDISSTKVRLFIRRGMSVQYLLPNSVIRYIQEYGLYVNEHEPVQQVISNKD